MVARNRSRQPREISGSFGQVLDLLGRRWALFILWELAAATMTFRELRAACGNPSPSVLQRRLHELRAMGVVEHLPGHGYRLSLLGAELDALLVRLERWSCGLPGAGDNVRINIER